MTKKPIVISRRAWRLLRLALMWARKGGLFHIMQKVIRKLGSSGESRGALVYGDREFSFDETPIVRVKMHRRRYKMPRFPCIGPQVDFDCDFGEDEEGNIGMWRDEYDHVQDEEGNIGMCRDEYDHVQGACGEVDDEEGIDVKAEKFIADFYEQMKRQRQISCLE